MDQTDIKILALLQKDATCSVAEIAEQVNLSVTPCWRRIQKLKDDGVIARNAILLDPRALGLNLTVFVSIKTSQHNEKWTQSLINAVMALPNVVEFHRMAGDIDYLLKVVVEDMAAYDRFYRRLIAAVDLLDVSASFSMEVIKSTTELPLDAPDTLRAGSFPEGRPVANGPGRQRAIFFPGAGLRRIQISFGLLQAPYLAILLRAGRRSISVIPAMGMNPGYQRTLCRWQYPPAVPDWRRRNPRRWKSFWWDGTAPTTCGCSPTAP